MVAAIGTLMETCCCRAVRDEEARGGVADGVEGRRRRIRSQVIECLSRISDSRPELAGGPGWDEELGEWSFSFVDQSTVVVRHVIDSVPKWRTAFASGNEPGGRQVVLAQNGKLVPFLGRPRTTSRIRARDALDDVEIGRLVEWAEIGAGLGIESVIPYLNDHETRRK